MVMVDLWEIVFVLGAKTATLVLAYGDGARLIGGGNLLLEFEGMSSNDVVAQVKVSGGLLESTRDKATENSLVHKHKQQTWPEKFRV